ncbi:hypothetical protein BDN71DRAFT_1435139 [Pleurotus eryngii]|uniref:DUF6589 domain-containing protein n=1 Tax=Pleurotus eryngii TaxID=5323 RepID=A0A9P5ZLN7_PLEER|nr:hypothetical protein BDN71DRAFT_1435139 [Pleurotus eryngii]
MFEANCHAKDVQHIKLALTIWAVNHVAELVQVEAERMVLPDANFGVLISSIPEEKQVQKVHEDQVTWDLIDHFSMARVKTMAKTLAPAMWPIMSAYSNRTHNRDGSVTRKYQPEDTSNCANLYPLCCGIWYFSVKAYHTIFHVESQLAQTVSYMSVYQALTSMAVAKRTDLQGAVRPRSQCFCIIIRHKNKMIKGLAGTAVEMQDIDSQGFDVKELIWWQGLKEWQKLTVEKLKKDTIEINLIPPTWLSKITPLATNGTDEMYVQELKQGQLGFLSNQMGVNAWIFSGDGKTFNQLLKMHKYLSVDEDNFNSFWCLMPLLKLWHTKWINLSQVV